MKMYIFSLAAGLLVGVIYSILNIRSPAPPLVALVGLLGILAGEQIIPVGKQLLAGSSLRAAWHAAKSASHVFGELPGRHSQQLAHTAAQSPETPHDPSERSASSDPLSGPVHHA
jgi:XapX domain-containing protein